MGCCESVPESSVEIVERCGEFDRIIMPGFNCMNCCTERVAGKVSFAIQPYTLNFETRTKDNVSVTIKFLFSVKAAESPAEINGKAAGAPAQARIGANVSDELVYRNFYSLKNPTTVISSEIESYFRAHAMTYTMDQLFAARDSLTVDLHRELNVKMNPFGYIITSVVVTDIDPDRTVMAAMNAVMIAEKQRAATLISADAAKAASIAKAEGDARVKELEGAGISAQRSRIVDGLKVSVQNFKEALPESDPNGLMRMVLMTQYLDMLNAQAATGRNTFILPSSPAHVAALEGEIGTALLGAGAARV